MSTLQQAIEANTAAIIALTEALRTGKPATFPSKDAGTAALETAGTLLAQTYHEQRAAAAEENLQAEDANPGMTYEKDVKPWAIMLAAKNKQAFLDLQAEDANPGVTYEKDVKPWAIKLAAKDKQAFLDLLAERSVKKGGDVPVEHLPEFLARIKRVLGE